MRIVGHGVDLVDKSRIEQMIADHGERFLQRCFTAEERSYSEGNTRRRMEHLAGRFAAKEAILKVLGTGWSGGIAWTDAEVVREASGRPTVRLHGRCAEVADELGIGEWWLSISHIETHAVASAIGVCPE
jgi:holo-[acyl-carrier protein] synthase